LGLKTDVAIITKKEAILHRENAQSKILTDEVFCRATYVL